MSGSPDRLRIDRWLWFARFSRTRSQAARLVAAGHVRVNGVRIGKPAHLVGTGDRLTFVVGGRVRVVRILASSTRRGPAPEARALYEDLSPGSGSGDGSGGGGSGGGPRPTKRERRRLERTRRQVLE